MSPTIVLKNGSPYLVLGSPGGPRILSAIFQTIWNRETKGLELYQAVKAPRFHQQWQPNRLIVEKGRFNSDILQDLSNRGHKIEESGFNVGSISAIEIGPGRQLIGVTDPRRDGVPIGRR